MTAIITACLVVAATWAITRLLTSESKEERRIREYEEWKRRNDR